jgi:hypothetical protein
VECRTGGANGTHTIIKVTFTNNIMSGNAKVLPKGLAALRGAPIVNNTITINH